MNSTKKIAIVTGATGFLGQYVTRALLQREFDVHILVRNIEKANQIFQHLPITIINASLNDPQSLLQMPEGAYIFHCAAMTGAIHASWQEYQKINVLGTAHLLKAAITRKAASFSLVSSVSAVGAIGSNQTPITEETIPHPKTYYGTSKLMSEKVVLEQAPEHLPITIIRPVLIYGKGQSAHSGANLLFKLYSRNIIPVFGKLDEPAPLIHAENVATGLIDLSLNNTGKEIFNLTDPNPVPFKDLMFILNPNQKKHLIPIPYPLIRCIGFLGDILSQALKKDFGLCSDNLNILAKNGFTMKIDKALKAGYKPQIKSEQGIRAVYNAPYFAEEI